MKIMDTIFGENYDIKRPYDQDKESYKAPGYAVLKTIQLGPKKVTVQEFTYEKKHKPLWYVGQTLKALALTFFAALPIGIPFLFKDVRKEVGGLWEKALRGEGVVIQISTDPRVKSNKTNYGATQGAEDDETQKLIKGVKKEHEKVEEQMKALQKEKEAETQQQQRIIDQEQEETKKQLRALQKEKEAEAGQQQKVIDQEQEKIEEQLRILEQQKKAEAQQQQKVIGQEQEQEKILNAKDSEGDINTERLLRAIDQDKNNKNDILNAQD